MANAPDFIRQLAAELEAVMSDLAREQGARDQLTGEREQIERRVKLIRELLEMEGYDPEALPQMAT